MKLFNIINKFALVLFWIFLISLCGLLVYVNNTQNLKTYNYAKNIKKILKFKRDEILPRFLNDYNSNFLPETHFINLKFFQKKQNFLTINDCYIGTCYTFYIEKNKKNIFLIDKNNNLYYSNIKNFLNKKNTFKKIDTNLNFLSVSDLYINENNIYVSGYKKNVDKEFYISIYKSSLNNLKSIDFKEFFKAKNKDESEMFTPERTPIATDKVRHVGDPIAIVIAETYEVAKMLQNLSLLIFKNYQLSQTVQMHSVNLLLKSGKIKIINVLIGKWGIKKKLMKLSKKQKL